MKEVPSLQVPQIEWYCPATVCFFQATVAKMSGGSYSCNKDFIVIDRRPGLLRTLRLQRCLDFVGREAAAQIRRSRLLQ
eukprot:572227-Amphidinium_carterae.1